MPLPADRLPASLRSLPAKVAKLERQLTELRASKRLAHSTIDGGAVTIRDATGAVRAVLGNQADGTVALTAVTGPVPPTPNAPVVTAQLAALAVTWDGTFAGGAAAPSDWLRCEVHISATAGFTPDQTTLRATVETPAGGTVLIALGYSAWYVKLRSVTTSGAVSTPTADVSGTPNQAGAGDITATAIDGKTITGALIQTAASGQRVTINESGNNAIDFYNSGGTRIMTLGSASNGSMFVGGGTTHEPIGIDAGTMTFWATGGGGLLTPDVQAYAYGGGQVFFNTQLNGGVAFKNGAWVSLQAGSDTLQTWQTPGYTTGWSGSTTFNGSTSWQTLRYRIDAEDNLWLVGAFKVGAGAGTTIFTVPTHPTTQSPLPCFTVLSGAFTIFPLTVTTTGAVVVSGSAGGSIASGREYLVNAKVPLGNLA